MQRNNAPPNRQQAAKLSADIGGAYTRVVATERAMKTYPLNQNELRSITLLNATVSILTSVATTLVLLGIGLKTNAVIEGVLTEQGHMLVNLGCPILWVVGGVFYAGALVAFFFRRSMLRTIERETKVIE